MDSFLNDPFEHLPEAPDLRGQVTIEDYKPVYSGPYSCVYRGIYRREGQTVVVAIKVLNKIRGAALGSTLRKLKRERRTWGALCHPNILPLYGFMDDEEFFQPGALVSPWLQKGDAETFLADHGNSMKIEKRINLWKDVVAGVDYLHSFNPVVIHGDLKPRNVLIDEGGHAQICDFGLSRIFLEEGSSGMTTTSIHTGTERYLARELVLGGDEVNPTTASDVHAMGCIGLEFIFLQMPYSDRKNNFRGVIYADIRKGVPPVRQPVNSPHNSGFSWTLLADCWDQDPAKRPDASQVLRKLETLLGGSVDDVEMYKNGQVQYTHSLTELQDPYSAVKVEDSYSRVGLGDPFSLFKSQDPYVPVRLQDPRFPNKSKDAYPVRSEDPYAPVRLEDPYSAVRLKEPYARVRSGNSYSSVRVEDPYSPTQLKDPYSVRSEDPYAPVRLQDPYFLVKVQDPYAPVRLPIQQHERHVNPNSYRQPPYGGYVTESNSPSQYPQRYPMQVEQGNNHVDLQRSRNMEEISYYGGGLPTGAWDVQQHLESSRPPYGPHSSVLHAPAFPQFPRTHRVKITVVSASDLIKRGFFQLPDPYVELQVDCELAYTTSTVKTTLNPYWDKGTEVTVTDSSMIMVKVYDMRKSQKPGSGILGKVEFCVDNVLGPDYSELKTLTTDLTTFSLLPSSRGKITLRLEPIATISPGQSRLPNTGPVASHLIERLCLQCRNAQCIDGKVYCGLRCVAISRNGAPKLVELPAAHYMFRRISDMFKEAWRHHTTAPTPQYIFVIVSTEENDRMYNAYKQGIESQRNFLAQNLTEGNEQYRWYGTIRECNVGDPGRGVLCTSAHCSTCWVIRHSFDVDRFGQDCGSGRGVYSSADSFTANRHSKTFNQSPWTAQLLTSVVVGGLSTGYDKDGPKMPDYPPDGHDRIGGQRGKPLTYNGTVVYRNDAIRPMYLVLYLTPRAPSS